jgi:hypothetical protein
MSAIKDISENEHQRMSSGVHDELHLWREGTFLRAYEWSAWLACRYLHEFKVNRRAFKGVDSPVVYIGFPEASLMKWMPDGVTQTVVDEKHLMLKLPELMLSDDAETIVQNYTEWHDAIPLTEGKERSKKGSAGADSEITAGNSTTLTAIMQRILAFPIESKSPLESMTFLAEVKQQLATLI